MAKLSSTPDWLDSELLAEGFAANPKTLRALQRACRFSDEQAAAACLVSLRTYRRWLSSGNPDPTALRLLAVLAGFVPWSGWDGWEVHNGYLFPPGYSRGGIPPAEFFALVFYRQQVTEYQRHNAQLRVELEAARHGRPAPALTSQFQALAVQIQTLGGELAALGARLEPAAHG
ncbi:hypothetical protein [Thiocystis violacea]|uniref:hypothetical protein n=1 Tax=Thiocystis violacea TaxID=13725 RepID=UPI001904CCAA|nr:hypothetical protein [Thiocystis violacea]